MFDILNVSLNALIGFGVVTVFGALVLFWCFLKIIKLAFCSSKNNESDKGSPINQAHSTAGGYAEDGEVVAVIAAAVAAMFETPTQGLRIRSIRRVGNNSPAWSTAGREKLLS
ncbi:MAG: Oxaloacetate decarboxylase, gamma chain [Firmicutes bacterium ADurb.Bin193]|nr:MAG: Oxaloacetate decarboxylase, gamma chain [Firmicutes bacterium ADurb.Bin193]